MFFLRSLFLVLSAITFLTHSVNAAAVVRERNQYIAKEMIYLLQPVIQSCTMLKAYTLPPVFDPEFAVPPFKAAELSESPVRELQECFEKYINEKFTPEALTLDGIEYTYNNDDHTRAKNVLLFRGLTALIKNLIAWNTSLGRAIKAELADEGSEAQRGFIGALEGKLDERAIRHRWHDGFNFNVEVKKALATKLPTVVKAEYEIPEWLLYVRAGVELVKVPCLYIGGCIFALAALHGSIDPEVVALAGAGVVTAGLAATGYRTCAARCKRRVE